MDKAYMPVVGTACGAAGKEGPTGSAGSVGGAFFAFAVHKGGRDFATNPGGACLTGIGSLCSDVGLGGTGVGALAFHTS